MAPPEVLFAVVVSVAKNGEAFESRRDKKPWRSKKLRKLKSHGFQSLDFGGCAWIFTKFAMALNNFGILELASLKNMCC